MIRKALGQKEYWSSAFLDSQQAIDNCGMVVQKIKNKHYTTTNVIIPIRQPVPG